MKKNCLLILSSLQLLLPTIEIKFTFGNILFQLKFSMNNFEVVSCIYLNITRLNFNESILLKSTFHWSLLFKKFLCYLIIVLVDSILKWKTRRDQVYHQDPSTTGKLVVSSLAPWAISWNVFSHEKFANILQSFLWNLVRSQVVLTLYVNSKNLAATYGFWAWFHSSYYHYNAGLCQEQHFNRLLIIFSPDD